MVVSLLPISCLVVARMLAHGFGDYEIPDTTSQSFSCYHMFDIAQAIGPLLFLVYHDKQ